MTTDSPRILIVKLGAVGDCVHTLYAARALRLHFPESHIAWAVEEKSFEVVNGHPDLSQVFRIERKSGISRWIDSARAVSETPYDITVDFSNLLKSGLVTKFSSSKKRIGFSRLREANFLFTNQRIVSRQGHMVQRYFRLLEPLGITMPDDAFENGRIPDHLKTSVFVPEEKKRGVDQFLHETSHDKAPIVLVNPHGTWPNKLYPIQHYATVCMRLIEEGARIVVAWGGPAEKQHAQRLVEMIGHRVHLAPPTDLKELAHLLSRSTMYLGNDTGPMHIAAAAGTAVVAVFGPTSPSRVGPLAEHVRVVTPQGICDKWPCEKKKCGRPYCINEIAPAKVIDAALSLMNELREANQGQ